MINMIYCNNILHFNYFRFAQRVEVHNCIRVDPSRTITNSLSVQHKQWQNIRSEKNV
jgi:hypothetical protein